MSDVIRLLPVVWRYIFILKHCERDKEMYELLVQFISSLLAWQAMRVLLEGT